MVGPAVFGSENPAAPLDGNAFQILAAMIDLVGADELTVAATELVDGCVARARRAHAVVLARRDALEDLSARNLEISDELRVMLQETETLDLADVILELRGQEASYTAALDATGDTLDGLLNNLR